MDSALVERLNKAANAALAEPSVKARMDAMGVEVIDATPAQFGETLKQDADTYGKLIRELGIKAE